MPVMDGNLYYSNPVIRGMYPDPSVCTDGKKYYLAASSFLYFPGVPLFESDDLINWTQIGNCLTRRSQLNLDGAETCSGIFAPTLRFYGGRFYMVTTNTSGGGSFFVRTDDIYGRWSEPVRLSQDGIDPSLFFDEAEDGDVRTYLLSNGGDGDGGFIQISRIDIESGREIGGRKILWRGHGGRFIEAPHLYKIDGMYYLIDAEGGTEYGHTVNYARSRNIFGPYEEFPRNPALTNRNLGGYELQGAGHGDLVQAADGSWWMLHLAFRQSGKWIQHHHLGREVCAEPVTWKGGWFYVADGTCRALTACPQGHSFGRQRPEFARTLDEIPDCEFVFLRNPRTENYRRERGVLFLRGTGESLESDASPTFVALRQCEFRETLEADVNPARARAGISAYMDGKHHADVFAVRDGDGLTVTARIRIGPASAERSVRLDGAESAPLCIKAVREKYSLGLTADGRTEILLECDTRYLSSETAGGFTGVVLAFFAEDGTDCGRWAEFRRVRFAGGPDGAASS